MYKRHTALAAVLALAIPGMASAARFSWFDDTPRDSLGLQRTPLFDRDTRLSFGIDAYKSLAPNRAPDEDLRDNGYAAGTGDTRIELYGEVGGRTSDGTLPIPMLHPTITPDGNNPLMSKNSRLSGFGIKLRHRLDATNSIALSAGYSETPWSVQSPTNLDVLDTRAALSWTSKWSGGLQPGMTGSVFIGDESMRDETYQRLGRRYYGFSVGGELRLTQEHTPYLSYRVRRNLDSPDDPNYLATPYDDRSQIAAGWRWQVQQNWSLQAEARYGLNGASLDPYSPDRSRIFFGTRFDFR